ncbi:MAG: DUF1801 domain-containing protein [Bacteroidota bacterium]
MSSNQKTIFRSVDEYILSQKESTIIILEKIRSTVRKVAPDAEEAFSYQMPAFKYHGMLCWYAVFKDHYSFFISPNTIEAFKEKLSVYKCSKGTIQMPYGKPVPVKLIADMIRYRIKENLKNDELKKKKKAT